MRIGVSGLVRANSGVGVIQREVHPRLARVAEQIESPTRDPGGRWAPLRGLMAGLRPPPRVDGYFCSVSPLPLKVRRAQRVVAIVHDLRWMRNAGRLKRAYRAWDLGRVVKSADVIVCVSERTRLDLLAEFPEAADTAVVSWLGPGIVRADAWSDGTPGSALLIGSGPHKRNELAAELIAQVGRGVVSSVVGVNVSEETQTICRTALGSDRCQFFGRVSDDELRRLYTGAEFYLHLGTDEGFGLPYVEALASGCLVVAVDQILTREVLGDAAVFVPDIDANGMATAWAAQPLPTAQQRSEIARRYSWEQFTGVVVDGLGLPRDTTE